MTEMTGSVVTDDDVRLAYKVVGEGRHNLLLMHGWGGSANSWNGFNRSLDPQKFTVFGKIAGSSAGRAGKN